MLNKSATLIRSRNSTTPIKIVLFFERFEKIKTSKQVFKTMLAVMCLCITTLSLAQKKKGEWQLSLSAPYLSQSGGTVGFAFDIKELGVNAAIYSDIQQRIQFLPQLTYFVQRNVSNNVFVNPEMVFKRNKSGKRFFLSSSVGMGYLLSLQKQDGSLNLATGELNYRYATFNYFLPNLNIGLGFDPKKKVGFQLKASYGRKLSFENANVAFLNLSMGLILKFNAIQ